MRSIALALAVAALASAGEKWPENAELVVKGLKFTEGPAWNPQGFLLFSDIPANRIYKWQEGKELTVFRDPSNNSNGLAIDPQGRLLACEHGARRVTRTETDGKITVLAERYEGKRLNSPNDLTLHSDGSVYFTDPPYGVKAEERELDFSGVYRLAPDGKLTLLVKELRRPNGIALSPDEKRLYVDDSEAKTVHVYDLKADGSVENGRLLINLGEHGTRVCDGLKVDVEGNLYVTGTDAVYVVSPDGKLLAKIGCPGQCTNCCFGEADRKTLFVTARTKEGGSLYRVRVPIPGRIQDKKLSQYPRGTATPAILAASKERGGGDATESIGDDERRGSRPEVAASLRVAAAAGRCCVAAPQRCPPSASPASPRLASGPLAPATRPVWVLR